MSQNFLFCFHVFFLFLFSQSKVLTDWKNKHKLFYFHFFPHRLLQVWQLFSGTRPRRWASGIWESGRSGLPDGRGSRTEDAAPTASPDSSSQAGAAGVAGNHWPPAAAPGPGTRHGHGAGPGQARTDGTSCRTHGPGQAGGTGRNQRSPNGECKNGKSQ